MILTCPACATQYRLKDGAIPPEGRQVRCAACKHKWHEEGATTPQPVPAEEDAVGHWPPSSGAIAPTHGDDRGIGGGPPQPDPDVVEPVSVAAPKAAAQEQMIAETPEPDVGQQQEVAAYHAAPGAGEQWGALREPSVPADDGFAAIPAMHEDDEEPRSGGAMRWILGIILIVVAAAAAFYFLAPAEYKARAGIAEAGESPLEVVITTRDRQRLASGNELLAISGRVINNTDRVQAIPPIHAELRNKASNKLVYQWTIAPPARSLAPGAAASFNSAEVDVPAGAEMLSLDFAT